MGFDEMSVKFQSTRPKERKMKVCFQMLRQQLASRRPQIVESPKRLRVRMAMVHDNVRINLEKC